jgi:WD40 repeat protein
MPTPPDPYTFTLTAHNQAALEELATAIEFAQGSGTFTLLLVRCNYRFLRQQMVAQAVELLEKADLAGPVHVLTLQPQDTNLYARVQDTIQGQRPGAVMVVAFDAIDHLDNLLVEINKRREEFRRNCPFPLVLWLNDNSYRHLQTLATDFESIAGGETIEFTLSAAALNQVLQIAATRYFEHLLQPNTPQAFQALRQNVDLGYLQPTEVDNALAELETLQGTLDPDLQTSVAFVRALDSAPDIAISLLRRCVDYWQSTEPLRQGLALFYLGQSQYQAAKQPRADSNPQWQTPRTTLEQSQQIFTQAGRPDLAAKVLNLLGRTYQKLNAWENLEQVAHQGIALHERYGQPIRLAQNYGFLARSFLERQQWSQAKQMAQQGLQLVEYLTPPQPWLQQLYLTFLARAEEHLGNPEASLQALETARAMGDQGRSSILVELYNSLQRQYRQQRRYLDAFEAKQRRLTVEQQYGLRAFVGARRLRAQRQELDPENLQPDTLDSVAPEITSSGRQGDLDTLLDRLSRSDYKVIVLHGDSGVGKSSLVNGGLIPALQRRALENRDNIPLLLRQYADWVTELEAQLTAALNRNHRWATCIDTVADSSRQRILNTLQRCESEKLRPVLVFDQFEEFFFANPDRLVRREFFQFVADCLNLQPSALKIVFSLREDYIHYLLEAKQLVRRSGLAQGSVARSQLEDILSKQVLYKIGNFAPADAHQMIETLTERAGFYLEPALVDALVQDLAGELQEVRPIELQIVGAQLQTESITTLAQYRQLGDHPPQTLVQHYLEDVVVDCGEDHRQLAELVLFLLTDERGTRPLKTQPELLRELEALGIVLPSPHHPTTPPTSSTQPTPPTSPTSRPPLSLVLHILTGSGIVVHLPDTPDDRYQLVHDYLAEVIRQQQAPRLELLVAELEEEKRQRRQLELQKAELTESNRKLGQNVALMRVEQEDLQQKNKQARRVLAGTVVTAGLLAAVTGGAALVSTNQARTARAEMIQSRRDAEERQLAADFDVIKADFQAGMATVREGVADRRSVAAIKREEEAQQKVEEALEQLESIDQRAKQEQQAAQMAIQAAEAQVAEARVASAQAQVALAEAELARAQALEEQAQARYEANMVRRVTNLERAGVTASQKFEVQETEALFTAFKLGKEVNSITQMAGMSYLAASPLLALQTNLNAVKETRLEGHQGGVYQVVFSPDGSQIATHGEDGTARLWDLQGNQLARLEGHQGQVYQVVFSPDGTQIATSGYDGTARLWDLQGNQLALLEGHQGGVYQVVFSPDGSQIATSGGDSTTRLWDLQGNQLALLEGHQGGVYQVVFSPDGSQIATSGGDGTTRLWDLQGNQLALLEGHQGPVDQVVFSPDGSQIATSGYDGTARLWDLQGNQLALLEGHQGGGYQVVFSPDGSQIATSGGDGTTRLWDLQGNQLALLEGHQGGVYQVVFSPDGSQIATSGGDGTTRLWDLQGNQLALLEGHQGGVYQVVFSPDGSQIATSGGDGTARLWDLQGNQLALLEGHQGPVRQVVFSPDGSQIATSGEDGTARLWDLAGESAGATGRPSGTGRSGGVLAGWLPDCHQRWGRHGAAVGLTGESAGATGRPSGTGRSGGVLAGWLPDCHERL